MTSRPMPMIFAWPVREVVGEVAVMLTVVRFRHEQLDVLPGDFGTRIAEDALGCRIERRDQSTMVDGDDPVDHMIHDGAHPLLGLPEFGLGPLALGNVPDDAGEVAFIPQAELADRQIHREGRAVLAPPDHFPPDADDLRLAGLEVAGEVAVVLAVVGFGHQQLDVLADDLRGRKAEDALRRRVEGRDRATAVDGDDPVEDVVDHRAQPLHGLGRFFDLLLRQPLAVGAAHPPRLREMFSSEHFLA